MLGRGFVRRGDVVEEFKLLEVELELRKFPRVKLMSPDKIASSMGSHSPV